MIDFLQFEGKTFVVMGVGSDFSAYSLGLTAFELAVAMIAVVFWPGNSL